MAMVEDKSRFIPIFDGSNFSNWKFRVEALLDEMDLLEVVEKPYMEGENLQIFKKDTAEQKSEKQERLEMLKKKDKRCKSQIIQRIADSHLECVKDAETAYEMWSILRHMFERKSIASQLLLRKKLLTMKLNPTTESMSDHFLKFDKIIRELRSSGATMEESDVVCHLLLTMPPEYEVVMTAIETLAVTDLTVSFVKSRLLDEELKGISTRKKNNREDQPSAVFVAPSIVNKRPKIKCFNCGMIGHKKANCKKLKLKHKSFSGTHTEAKACEVEVEVDLETCFSASTTSVGDETSLWFLDSGCSEHLMKSDKLLVRKMCLEKPIRIKIAKIGTFLTAKVSGDLRVEVRENGNRRVITIENVLVVPELDFNLLSVRKLEMNGYKIVFEKGRGEILKNDQVVATAYRRQKLYELEFFAVENNYVAASAVGATEPVNIWHRRFEHIRFLSIQIEEMKKDFQKKLENIQLMLERMVDQKSGDRSSVNKIERDLPLQRVEEVTQLNNQISNCENFRRDLATVLLFVGGHNLHKSTYSILKKLFHPELTLKFSACGKGQKIPFVNMEIYRVVKEVLLQRFTNATEQDILKSVIRFFISAKDRIKHNKN